MKNINVIRTIIKPEDVTDEDRKLNELKSINNNLKVLK